MPDSTYFIGTLFFLGLCGLCFWLLPESRRIILMSGAAWGHLGPIGEYWFNPRYWHPGYILTFRIDNWTFGIEDYLFVFAFAGMCAGLFDYLFYWMGKQQASRFNRHLFLRLLSTSSIFLLVLAFLMLVVDLPPVQASILLSCIGAVVLLSKQPSWILPAISLGILAGFGMWVFYWGFFIRLFPNIFDLWWNPAILKGITLAGVPVEEIAWAASAGLFLGPAARFAQYRP